MDGKRTIRYESISDILISMFSGVIQKHSQGRNIFVIEFNSSRYQIFVISFIRISAEFPAYIECNTHDRNGSLPALMPHCHLLAIITSCKTPSNADATRELVTYTKMGTAPHVIDLAVVGAVVGWFRIDGFQHPRWAIVVD